MNTAAPPAVQASGIPCANYEVVELYAETRTANSPDCRWKLISFGDDDPAKAKTIHLAGADNSGGDNAFVIDRKSGLAVYHFRMFHTARVNWLRDGRALIVHLDPGPGEDGTALLFALAPVTSKPVDLSMTLLADVFRRSRFRHAGTNAYVSYTGTLGGEWHVAASLEATRSGLPLKDSACYLYAVKPFQPTKVRFIGLRKFCPGP